jgi:glycerol-1-phosphate dehydrogenase [NAD(P)+]
MQYFNGWRLTPDDIPALREQVRPLIGDAAIDSVGLERVVIARDALEQLPGVVRALSDGEPTGVLLVMDQQPMRRGDADLKPLVVALLREAGLAVEVLALDGHGGPLHADMHAVEQVMAALRPGVAAIALGAGTICDITKHASHSYTTRHGQPHGPLIVVPTAASVAAFAICFAVLLIDGVKRTQPSRWPSAVVADMPTLLSAPHALTAAGFGDLVVGYVTAADWLLSDGVGMTNDFPPALIAALSDCDALLRDGAGGVGANDERRVAQLMGAIVLVGVLVGPTGQSTLLSGWEHVVSHVLDMTAEHHGRTPALHGAQVGVGTLLSALAYARLLRDLDPRQVDLACCYPDAEAMRARIVQAFDTIDPSGRMAAECWRDYALKLARWHAARPTFERWLAAWPHSTSDLRRYLAAPPDAALALNRARAPLLPEQLDPPIQRDQMRWALLHAHLIRRRFTIGDLLFFLGWLDASFVDGLLDEAEQFAG